MQDLKEFPCPNCSSELNYDAEKESLKCLHCNTVIEIAKSNQVIEELSFSEVNKNNAKDAPLADVEYKCSKCGQQNITTNNIVFFECKSCGNNVINVQAYKNKVVHPSSIIPFKISKAQAAEIFKTWIGKGFWNESALKDLSLIDKLNGSYIPFWTFDSNTFNEWSGNAGYHYYETETYTDSEGKTQTRSVQRTRWQYNSGSFEHFFDDILVCGNHQIKQEYVNKIYPFELQDLVPLNEQYILGWNAENYSQDIEESYHVAKQYIDNEVEEMASDALGGDVQSNLQVDIKIVDRTFKHIILPIWFCQYLYKGKNYNFMVNGQTGNIHGTKPLSTTKIVLAILIGLILIAVIVYFFMQYKNGGSVSNSSYDY